MVYTAVLTTGGGGGLRNKSIANKIFGGASRFPFLLRREQKMVSSRSSRLLLFQMTSRNISLSSRSLGAHINGESSYLSSHFVC